MKKEMVKSLNLPGFLKPLFDFYNNDQLLIEASLLLQLYTFDLLDGITQSKFEEYFDKISQERESRMKDEALFIGFKEKSDFTVKFSIPSYFLPFLPLMEEDLQTLIIFSLLGIFHRVESREYIEYWDEYEESFRKEHDRAFEKVLKQSLKFHTAPTPEQND